MFLIGNGQLCRLGLHEKNTTEQPRAAAVAGATARAACAAVSAVCARSAPLTNRLPAAARPPSVQQRLQPLSAAVGGWGGSSSLRKCRHGVRLHHPRSRLRLSPRWLLVTFVITGEKVAVPLPGAPRRPRHKHGPPPAPTRIRGACSRRAVPAAPFRWTSTPHIAGPPPGPAEAPRLHRGRSAAPRERLRQGALHGQDGQAGPQGHSPRVASSGGCSKSGVICRGFCPVVAESVAHASASKRMCRASKRMMLAART